MKTVLVIALGCVVLSLAGCARTVAFGSEYGGFDKFPPNPVSVRQAISKARPYLDQTFFLRSSARSDGPGRREPVVYVTLKGDYYYIVRDNYANYSPGSYLRHAVRVNRITGQVMPPK